MKKTIILFLVVLFLTPYTVFANEEKPSVSAECAVVIDMDTRIILFEKNAHNPHSVASTTKIMTSYLALQSERLEESIIVNEEMLKVNGSSIGLEVGNKITLYDDVVGMMLASGNDAANAAAIFLDGNVESFVTHMNECANEIGMYDTMFSTPSGLDNGDNHSSAYDMALITSVALKNTTFASICSMKSANITIDSNTITLYNHNKLLSQLDSCIGVKTGYTDKAGRCLVSAVKYNGRILICVTLNDSDDWNDHKKLIKYAKSRYHNTVVSDDVVIPCVGGTNLQVKASYKINFFTVDDYIVSKIYYYPFLYAPVNKGDIVGYVVINDTYSTLVAGESVKLSLNEVNTS